MKIHSKRITKHGEIDYDAIAKLCEDFNGADLRNANLSYADLSYANLYQADLRRTGLHCVDFQGADLRGAIFDTACFETVNLTNAIVPFTSFLHENYPLNYSANKDEIRFIAGCRNFNLSEAKNHWLNDSYYDKDQGKRMYHACEFLYRLWDDKALIGIDWE